MLLNRQEFIQQAILQGLQNPEVNARVLVSTATELADKLGLKEEPRKSYILVSTAAPGALEGCFDNEADALACRDQFRLRNLPIPTIYEVHGNQASSYLKRKEP